MHVTSNLGEKALSRYTFMPPDRGMLVPNSSIIRAPQVESRPAMTQMIKAIPTLPLCLNIVAGVEKTLMDVSLVDKKNALNTPCPYYLVHDQRDGSKHADTPGLQDMGFLYMERNLGLDICG